MQSFVRAALAVTALDLRLLLLTRRIRPLLILGIVPVMLSLTIASLSRESVLAGRFIEQFSGIFQGLVLAGTLFFGVAAVFTGVLGGEMQEKCLHYVLLTPIRREAVAAGKYLAAFLATSLTFALSTALSYTILLSGAGAKGRERLLSPEGMAALGSYVLASVLACAAYGGLFLALSLLGKSPMVPAILFWLFERGSIVFPPVLKRLVPIHHLDSLLPFHFSQGPFALIVEPSPWWVSVPMLLLFGGVFATVAAVKARGLEVRYGGE